MSSDPAACLEAEELAALRDGTLDAAERARVVEHLASCEACREWLVELEHAMEQVDATVPAKARLPLLTWLPAVAAAAVIGVLLLRGITPADPSLDELLQPLTTDAGDVVPHLWSRDLVRGAVRDASLAETSFALGVLDVDLAVAIQAGDVARTRERLQLAASRLEQLTFMDEGRSALLAAATRVTRPADLAGLRDVLRHHRERLAERLDRDHLALGRWAEAGRLAAASGRGAFFADEANRRFAETARARGDLAPDAAAELANLTSRWPMRAGRVPTPEVERDFGQLIELLSP